MTKRLSEDVFVAIHASHEAGLDIEQIVVHTGLKYTTIADCLRYYTYDTYREDKRQGSRKHNAKHRLLRVVERESSKLSGEDLIIAKLNRYEEWIVDQDVEDIIKWATEWHNYLLEDAKKYKIAVDVKFEDSTPDDIERLVNENNNNRR